MRYQECGKTCHCRARLRSYPHDLKCVRLELWSSGASCKDLVNQVVQFRRVERLFQVSPGAQSQAADRVLFLAFGADDDDRDLLGNTQGRGLLQKLETVHDRHVDV